MPRISSNSALVVVICMIAFRGLNDQPVLDTFLTALKTSDADYLITGDKELLAFSGSYPIITPAIFWEKHGAI